MVVEYVVTHKFEDMEQKRNRAEAPAKGVYVWKALSASGHLFFLAITTPLKVAPFREFVDGFVDMESAPPVEYRLKMVKTAHGTDYTMTVDAIRANREIDWTSTGVKAVLVELAALWSVTRNIFSPVTLRVYLYLGQTEESLAKASPESALKDLPLSVSHVTNLMLPCATRPGPSATATCPTTSCPTGRRSRRLTWRRWPPHKSPDDQDAGGAVSC